MPNIVPKKQPSIGHNSGIKTTAEDVEGVGRQRLKAFVERIERQVEEVTAAKTDLNEIYAEAKAVGFDTKILRKLIRLRAMETEKRNEEEQLLELYKAAIGME